MNEVSTAVIRLVGPGVVVRAYQGGGNVQNAFDVLVDAFDGDTDKAITAVLFAASEKHVDPNKVLRAIT